MASHTFSYFHLNYYHSGQILLAFELTSIDLNSLTKFLFI